MPDFPAFWDICIRKVGRGAAEKAYDKSLKKVSHETIMVGMRNSVAYWQQSDTEINFIPHPSTWLNQQRWHDEEHRPKVVEETAYCKAFKKRWETRTPDDWRALCGGAEKMALRDWDQSIHGPKPASIGDLRRMYRVDQWSE